MALLPAVRAFFAAQPPALLAGLAGVVILLGVAGLVAAALTALRPEKSYLELRQRIASWWVMVALLAGALLAGWQATVAVFALISFMALREFLSLAPIRREDRPAILAAYLALAAAYGFIAADRYMFYLVFIPVWTFLGLPFLMAMLGQTRGFLTTAATFHWGLVTCVYNLGFAALLMRAPAAERLPAGAAGLVFFLLLATEFNDVAQYVFGKLFGRRKIAPTVSPNKTWEGFLGGWLAAGLLIWFLGPVFTPLAGRGLLVMAFALPLAGFAGDVTMSAVKRDIGVKDTSHAIPGHGGVLDRADSLTFTAPLYFHLLALFALDKF
ncbi:phosphatidate cytidylyltransferase [Caulobacter sp. LARHSG274]